MSAPCLELRCTWCTANPRRAYEEKDMVNLLDNIYLIFLHLP